MNSIHEFEAELFRGTRPLFLHALGIPAGMSVAVLAPHPDDFDAIGITMRFFRDNGNRIDVAVLTSGGSGVEDGFGGAFTAAAKEALREGEQKASCRFFGLPENRLTFLHLTLDEHGHPSAAAPNLERVRAYLMETQPQFVFLPHGYDTNAGHQRAYTFFRRAATEGCLSLVACLNRDPKTIAMRQDLYSVFDDEAAKWKGQLLRFHQSQHQRNLHTRGHGFDERILSVNRQTARELGADHPYAEVFELERFGQRIGPTQNKE
jgi:LmbE family N-acetylglucosaminyl deacetylase